MTIEFFITQAVVVLIIVLLYRTALGVVSIFHNRDKLEIEAVANGAGRYYLDDDNRPVFRWHPPVIPPDIASEVQQ